MANEEPEAAVFNANPELIEEITLGLPPEAPAPARLDEVFQVNRYLMQSLRRLERDLMDGERVDSLLADLISGIRRVLGCSEVELMLHDPVGELAHGIGDWSSLFGMLQLTADSHDIDSLYTDEASPQWLSQELARELGVFEKLGVEGDVVLVPLVEGGVVVGSLHLQSPREDILHTDADLEVVFDFATSLPILLRKASGAQATSELMLLDPVTHVSNRNGLERDLERELGRARRAHRTVSLIGITLCGLEAMGNLSQRHLQAQVLRQIAHRISGGLRVTDSMGRLAVRSFGVLVADAQAANLADIAWRYENDLKGHTIDDGMGGVVEVNPVAVWVTVDPEQYSAHDSTALAAMMVETALTTGDCSHRGEVQLKGATQEGTDKQGAGAE